MSSDVPLGRIIGRRDLGPVDEERHPGLVGVESLLESDDVREVDEVAAADEVSEADPCCLARVRVATLGRRLAGFNDYTAEQAIGLYPTDGTTDDFAYGELGVPAYTFELGTQFFQNCATFENTILPDNREALRYAARALRAPYVLPSGPDAEDARIEPDLVLAGEPATLRVRFDDARQQTDSTGASGPVPAVQPIASVR